MDMHEALERVLELRTENDREHKPERVNGREIWIPTDTGKMRALIYREDGSAGKPLFIDIHGGAFIFASPEEDDYFCSRLHDELGMTVVSLDYPLAPEARFPRALHEIYAAIRHICENADAYGIDPENVSIGGHSAGGNLAAAVCLLAGQKGELRFCCQLLSYPWVDPGCGLDQNLRYHDAYDLPQELLDFAASCYADADTMARDALCSPVRAECAQLEALPPTILLTCEHDSLRTEGEVYGQKLMAAGLETSFRRQKDAGHGFTIFPDPLRDAGLNFLFDGLKNYI